LLANLAPVDPLDKDGCTPLHYAAAYGFLPGIEVLVESGANYNVKNKQGWTPRDWAYSNQHDNALQEMVRKYMEDRKLHGNPANKSATIRKSQHAARASAEGMTSGASSSASSSSTSAAAGNGNASSSSSVASTSSSSV